MFDLRSINDAMNMAGFKGELHFLEETGSTNTDAVNAAQRGARDGSLWLANSQTAGRGRSDHKWQSISGQGIYLSLLIRPHINPAHLQLLPLATGLAAIEAIQNSTSITADLRWPNDLLIGPSKVGGILVESRLTAANTQVDFAVIGIGINVHQRVFPSDLGATSITLEIERAGTDYSIPRPDPKLSETCLVRRQSILFEFFPALARTVKMLDNPESQRELLHQMTIHSTWIQGRSVNVHGPQACSGTTRGLDANGMLLVETTDGLRTIITGGIRDTNTSNERK